MYKGNKNKEAPPHHEVAILKKIIKSKPPLLKNPIIELKTKTKYSKEGYKYTVTIEKTLGLKPKFNYIESDLIDSYWYYPVIRERIIAKVNNATESSHSEYFNLRNKNKNKKK